MDELELPLQLDGPWEHALVLTYGADLPFFENALWSQFKARCRNRIILADGQRYLESCVTYARGRLVRHLNQRYVAEGVFAPRAAHAKLILLANPDRGRLLIGSGNLGWQGYASGGELFTQYEYSRDTPHMLNAFVAVRGFVDGVIARGYVGPPAARRIRYLWEKTPWLFQPPEDDWQPVRHNLDYSFLDQLKQTVGDQPVDELWVLSPFYDREVVALERLLSGLNPRRATLLMQPGYTSVDPEALQRVLNHFGKRCRVRSFGAAGDSPYVHAKMYLVKAPNRAICLQGSPNLSQVAMLFTVPQGNIELANLLTGPDNAFDELLDRLSIQTTAEPLDALDLRFQSTDTPLEHTSEQWYLTGGEWHDDRLSLRFQGTVPNLRRASLIIANRAFPIDVHRRDYQGLELKLSADVVGLLGHPLSLAIRWGEGDNGLTTNPVFVCNRAALDAVLEVAEEGETLNRIGDLDLDDEEFERLLAELDAALVFDRRGVWTLAGRTPPSTADEDDDALRLEYADVDYEMLRQHPKLRQYVLGRSGDTRYVRSRLQIILNSITGHFRGLLDVASGAKLVEGAIGGLEDSQAETEEEREEEEQERQRRRQSYGMRLRRILKNFVRRYLHGLQSPDFQELAGFEVITHNHVIFSHLLWRLFSKDWVEAEFVIASFLKMWGFFWGRCAHAGYLEGLDEDQQAQVLELVQGDQHADAVLLASLYYSARLSRVESWQELRFALRDLWRHMLLHLPFELDTHVLENSWHTVAELFPYEPPLPSAIVAELAELAQFETEHSFLRGLEEHYQYQPGSCRFEKANVSRGGSRDSVPVDCLVMNSETALADEDIAIAIVQAWMRFKDLDYYRIASPDCRGSRRVCFYEVSESAGVYWARDRGEPYLTIKGPLVPQGAGWDTLLSHLQAIAQEVDAGLVLAVDGVSVAPLGQSASQTSQ